MVEPPPHLKPSNNADPTTAPTIADITHNLRDLLAEIPLPKTRNAKTATITLEVLHCMWDLATSVLMLLHEHPIELYLSNISKQLDAVTTCLGTPDAAQALQSPPSPQDQLHASVLATGIQSPVLPNDPSLCTRARFNLTLTQKSYDHPVLMELSSWDLSDRIYTALQEADCWHETHPVSPDSEGNDLFCSAPRIWAVGHHCSSDLWVLVASEAMRDTLINSISVWLPKLLGSLTYIPKTYPVLVHGVPTSFDRSCDSSDIHTLLDTSLDIITHPCSLQHAEFLIHNPSHLRHKAHSSVILHFTDPDAANSCIAHQVSLHGRLLRTVKFIWRPPSCYHCHQLGHFARDCILK